VNILIERKNLVLPAHHDNRQHKILGLGRYALQCQRGESLNLQKALTARRLEEGKSRHDTVWKKRVEITRDEVTGICGGAPIPTSMGGIRRSRESRK